LKRWGGPTGFEVTIMVNCMLIESKAPERQALAGLLESFGLECSEHAEPAAALRSLDEQLPDLVVMEQTETTSDFLRLISLQHRKPVVIVYGDHADFDATGRAILDGASEVLVKPFDRDLLKFKLAQSGVFAF
jgi:two-component system, chemotaxis family, chemotaxis protein CheY